MTYVLQSAIGVKKAAGSRWSSVNITTIPLNVLFEQYRAMYITLSNNQLANPVSIDFEILRANYFGFTGTIANYITNIGNTTITPTVIPPVLNPKYAIYSDAFRAGYKFKAVDILAPNNDEIYPNDRTSLQITRPKIATDMEVFHKNCIVSVNGFWHRTDFGLLHGYVLGGSSARFKSRENKIGILSFRELGQIECVPIIDTMIYPQAVGALLKDRTYIKLNKDLTNKTVMLVLGGYLLFIDSSSFWQTGADVFALDFQNMPLLERFFEAEPYMDYRNLGLPFSTTAPGTVSINDLYSDAVLRRYMKMNQSFFVILDTPQIFTNKIHLRGSGLPGMFVSYRDPIYPLFVSTGRVAEYWKTKEDSQWSVSVADSYLHNRVLSTIPREALTLVNNSSTPADPVSDSYGYLLEIGKDY